MVSLADFCLARTATYRHYVMHPTCMHYVMYTTYVTEVWEILRSTILPKQKQKTNTGERYVLPMPLIGAA